MAKGINKVIIVGNLGQDPETRFSAAGAAITNASVATSESWKDKETGQKQERTEWHRLVFFNRLGEVAGEYLKKGSKIYAEGQLRTRKWQNKDGVDMYTTEIVVKEMQMLDSKGGVGDVAQGAASQGAHGGAPSPQAAPQQAPQQQAAPSNEDWDDDIPF